MRLVRGIEQAAARRHLVAALNRTSTRLGVKIIAEGIETPAEADVCRQLGCHFGQGYFFGPPTSIVNLTTAAQDTRPIDPVQLRALAKLLAPAKKQVSR